MLVEHELKSPGCDSQPFAKQVQGTQRRLLVLPNLRQPLRPREAAMPDLAAGMIGHLRVAVLVELYQIMQVHVVETVDEIVTVEGSSEARRSIAGIADHLLVLHFRIPAHVVAEIDAEDADVVQVAIIGVAILPDVILGKCVEVREHVVCFETHQVVVLAITPGHLHFVFVGEHPHLLQPLVGAPDDQRNLVPNGCLNRENRLPGQAMPVDAAETPQRCARDLLDRNRVDVLYQDVAIEADAQVRQVADTQRRVEVLVVGDQQRVQSQAVLDQVHDVMGIVGPRHRHDAIVVAAVAASIGGDQRLQLVPARLPVEAVLLLVDAATRADAFFIQREAERMIRGVEAAPAGFRFGHVGQALQ